MASKIGLRVYLIAVSEVKKRKSIPLNSAGIRTSVASFFSDFAKKHSQVTGAANQDTERERSWYFEPRPSTNITISKGYIRYGTFGFESDLVDSKTRTRKYRRRTDDVEIIPLFYEFWHPPGSNYYAFVAFQSFQGRSCIELVTSSMRDAFSKQNPGFQLLFKKLLPTGASGVYSAAPVKSLRLIKRNAPADVVDRYLKAHVGHAIDFEIRLTARRKGFLGKLGAVTDSLRPAKVGVVEHDGVSFEEAVAEIDFGGKRRPIGIFGHNSEAGVIDLTDAIKRGPDGHPTFDSLSKESRTLLMEFQTTMANRQP